MAGFRVAGKIVLMVGVAVMLIASSNFGAVRNAAAAPDFGDWSAPASLGPLVNSPSSDTGPAISKDSLSLFLGSDRVGGLGSSDLYVSQRASRDEPWGPPVNLGPTVNTVFIENVPALSRDEHWMFFNSPRPGGLGGNDIWASYREHVQDDFAWQVPVNLGPGVNSEFGEFGPSYFENDEAGVPLLFFASERPGGLGGADIYVSAQMPDGSWGAPEHLEELSSSVQDQRPVIRFDGLELFFFSNRPGGVGSFDIWVSTRNAATDPWSAPVNLGAPVNTPQADIQGYLGSDRRTLYFSSTRPGGLGGNDLYVTTRAGPGGSD